VIEIILRAKINIIFIVTKIDGESTAIIFLLQHFEMTTIEKSIWLKAKLKGKKSTTDSLKSAVILKTRPKQYFLAQKVPKPRGVIFCQPPFSGLFLREKKLFLTRYAYIKTSGHGNKQAPVLTSRIDIATRGAAETDLLGAILATITTQPTIGIIKLNRRSVSSEFSGGQVFSGGQRLFHIGPGPSSSGGHCKFGLQRG
jgi:hypothetical protein